MNSQKLRFPLLVGAIAAVAATAWAANETYETTTVAEPIAVSEPVAVREPITVAETLSPNETLVVKEETALVKQEAPLPVVEREITQPGITVEERRLSRDEAIQLTVMDLLRNNDRLTGLIGVESNDSVVRLSGWTMTAGQARRAGQAAAGVIGVRHVENEIRPRIGGSI
jgi:hyperosmotically inducible periplasmic protein